MISRTLALLLTLAFALSAAAADPTLFEEIQGADKELFDAFNAHDAERMAKFFSEDVEFYHDKDGLVRYPKLMEGFRSMAGRNDGLRRDLVPDSLQVFPIPNFGAMEIGSHRFCHMEHGKEDCGVFQFAHVWEKKDGRWRITRVLSYGH